DEHVAGRGIRYARSASDITLTNKEHSMADPVPLPPLPYPEDALSHVISANTLQFHHGKHHKAYVDNLNKLLPGSEFEGKSLEEIVKASYGKNPGVFNNAGQDFNH